ncbi:MAG: hypothetical protein J5757_07465 [Lachnospiraceae bacterium]|nr:hypothetical protein [Lachnospiraceae bacterium]
MINGFFGGGARVECGGYASHQTQMKSLVGKVSGLKKFNLNYSTESMGVSFSANLETGVMDSSIVVAPRYSRGQPDECSRTLTPEECAQLSETVFATNILEYNGYAVIVNGLPPIEDMTISMNFEKGDDYYMSYNGGRGPGNVVQEVQKLFPLIFELADYSPGKGRPIMPTMPSVLGTHRFEFTEGKKHGTLTIRIDTLRRRDEGQGELFSEGDFGKKHFIFNTGFVHTGNGRYDLKMIKELEDSIGTTPDNWHFAAMLTFDWDGRMKCEAFSAMPDLKDRAPVYEIDPVEKLASAFLYCDSGDTFKTFAVFLDDNEKTDYLVRTGWEDPETKRFFYSDYKADTERFADFEKLATLVKLHDWREYLKLGSDAPLKSKVWLELNYRYGRSVILSEEKILEAVERTKDESIKEPHLELFRQLCKMIQELTKPENIVSQGFWRSGREVGQLMAETEILQYFNTPLVRVVAVTPKTAMSPEQLSKLM